MARYFGISERFWMNLQGRYDLEVERDRLLDTLEEIQPLRIA
jgi:antitoxin HigA-1